jgi:hypothetical protein
MSGWYSPWMAFGATPLAEPFLLQTVLSCAMAGGRRTRSRPACKP